MYFTINWCYFSEMCATTNQTSNRSNIAKTSKYAIIPNNCAFGAFVELFVHLVPLVLFQALPLVQPTNRP